MNHGIEDKSTNIVYLSKWLKEEHEEFYSRLTTLFDTLNIKYDILKYTNDFWYRDYMPIQLDEDIFIKYRYYPNYLLTNKEHRESITNCSRACKCIGVQYQETKLIIDGGNVVPCGDAIIMTDKVVAENGYSLDDDYSEFVEKLKAVYGKNIVLIPWKEHPGDDYGHADGLIKYAGENKILMSNIADEYPDEGAAIERILTDHGYSVTTLHFEKNRINNWAYINFLQVGDKIIMPAFGIKEDKQAMEQIQKSFPYCSIYPIEMKKVAGQGGALHCTTWNIRK